MDFQITGNGLSVYAAVTATASIVISLYPHWHDRARPTASASRDMVTLSGSGTIGSERYLSVTIGNRGRRPITITQVALHDRVKRHVRVLRLRDGPKEICEGQSMNILAAQSELDFDAIDKMLVCDATGQNWQA